MFTTSPMDFPLNFNNPMAANLYYRLQAAQQPSPAVPLSNMNLQNNYAASQFYNHNARLLQTQHNYEKLRQMFYAANRFQQQNEALNVKRPFEEKNFNLDSFECQKKICKDNNEDEIQSLTSTQDGDQSQRLLSSPPFKTGDSEKIDMSPASFNQSVSPVKKIIKNTGTVSKKGKNEQKVVNALFDHEKQKLVFQVEAANSKEARRLTREEVIKEDPMLLLSFYEKHLQFSKTLDFNPENLMKVD